jgi:hypothetical protein
LVNAVVELAAWKEEQRTGIFQAAGYSVQKQLPSNRGGANSR